MPCAFPWIELGLVPILDAEIDPGLRQTNGLHSILEHSDTTRKQALGEAEGILILAARVVKRGN